MDAEQKLETKELLEKERILSDKLYSPMIVKTILFGIIGTITTVAIGFLTTKVLSTLIKLK